MVIDVNFLKYLSCSISCIAASVAALGVSRIFVAYFESVARNPSASEILNKRIILAASMVEAMGIAAVGLGFVMLFM